MNDTGITDFNELSDEDYLELIETVCWQKSIDKQLEIIFSYVGFDEEGYLGKYYHDENGKYFIPDGQENIVFRFIEKKKSDLVLKCKNQILERNLKEIASLKEKLRFLHAKLENIERQVNANPTIFYGFNKTELKEYIAYPEAEAFQTLRNIKPSIHDEPFRGAILKGEGAAYSQFKNHIHDIIDKLTEPKIDRAETKDLPEPANSKISFEDYLTDSGKKIFPFLFENYRNARPKKIAYMLFALKDLGYVQESDLYANKTQLTAAIETSFNIKLLRQSLSSTLNKKRDHGDSERQIISKISNSIKIAFDVQQ